MAGSGGVGSGGATSGGVGSGRVGSGGVGSGGAASGRVGSGGAGSGGAVDVLWLPTMGYVCNTNSIISCVTASFSSALSEC